MGFAARVDNQQVAEMHLGFLPSAAGRRDPRSCYLANRIVYAHLNRLAFPKLFASIEAEGAKLPLVSIAVGSPSDLEISHNSQRACKTVPTH